MLGSAIPKRWVVSLALVGLVSLFMASYAAVWTSPASAGSTGGTVPGQILTDITAPTSMNLQTGQVVSVQISPFDEDGNVDLDMPNIIYSWNAGSCGTFADPTTTDPANIFTAGSSACNGSLFVHGNQNSGPIVPMGGLEFFVNVFSPPPTPAPTAIPSDPVDTEIVPFGLGEGEFSVILPSSGGIYAVTQTIGSAFDPAAFELRVPGGALDSGSAAAVTIFELTPSDVPPPPPPFVEGPSSGTFTFGSSIIDVQWYDDSGSPLDTFRLNRPAEICVPFNQSDLDGAYGGPDGLALYRYNTAEWAPLNSVVNVGAGTVCGNTSNFSSFALGLAVAPPDTTSAEADVPTGLPATGDFTPGVNSLILAMMAGIALVGGGVFAARRARRVRENS